ncbi:hypothetical protein A9Q99_18515 [Gammaproteobacteria bacterium 45_16_T64]|nr:hypothetical protein A9Q99_18515 [Gammaproteobacteria bacterium 45_16_T64]
MKDKINVLVFVFALLSTGLGSGLAWAAEGEEANEPSVGGDTATLSTTETLTPAAPTSILIAPVVNHSVDVDAPNIVLSTLPIPMAGRGYYVFPVNTTKIVLEQEGFYEAEVVHQQDPTALAALFGADAILYVVINRWEAQYIVLSTRVTVDFSYRLVSKAGEELWQANQILSYEPNQQNSNGAAGLIASLIVSAVENTSPRYLSLTEKANSTVFRRSPTGPYYVRGKR